MSLMAPQEVMDLEQIAEAVKVRYDNALPVVQKLVADGVVTPVGWVRQGDRYRFHRLDSITVAAVLSPPLTRRIVKRWDELERQVREESVPKPVPHLTTDQIAQALGVKPSPSFLNNAGIGRTCLRDLDLHNHYERQPDGSTKFSLVGALVVGLCHSKKVTFTDALYHLKVQNETLALGTGGKPAIEGV